MSAAFVERAFAPARRGPISWGTTSESRGFLGTMAGLATGVFMGILLSLWLAAPVSAQGEDGEMAVEVAGAVDSFQCPAGLRGLTVAADAVPADSGLATATDGTLAVIVERTNGGPMLRFFNFYTNIDIGATVVRSVGALRFDHLRGTTSGRELHAGANYQGLANDVNDIQFCY